MKLVMIKEGPIDGIIKSPGDEIDVDNSLGARLINFGFAKGPGESGGEKTVKEDSFDAVGLKDLHKKAKGLGLEVKGINTYKGEEGKALLIEMIKEAEGEKGPGESGGEKKEDEEGSEETSDESGGETSETGNEG